MLLAANGPGGESGVGRGRQSPSAHRCLPNLPLCYTCRDVVHHASPSHTYSIGTCWRMRERGGKMQRRAGWDMCGGCWGWRAVGTKAEHEMGREIAT
nr:hypothetical protein CFP56_33545 [Quercus suber]